MNLFKAIVLKLISALLFAAMSALVRQLGDVAPVGQMVFFRSAFAILPVVVIYTVRGELSTAVRTGRPFGQLGRGRHRGIRRRLAVQLLDGLVADGVRGTARHPDAQTHQQTSDNTGGGADQYPAGGIDQRCLSHVVGSRHTNQHGQIDAGHYPGHHTGTDDDEQPDDEERVLQHLHGQSIELKVRAGGR